MADHKERTFEAAPNYRSPGVNDLSDELLVKNIETAVAWS
jgi:hypothetical protein